MNKKKLTKATSGLLLTALMVGGAAAFLSTSQTGTKTNSIKIGQISIMFDNQQNAILLTDTYPMSAKYAAETLTPYTFDIVNDGDIDVDYKIYAVDLEGNMDADYINFIVDYAAPGNSPKLESAANAKAFAGGIPVGYGDGTNTFIKVLSGSLITDNGDGTYNIPADAQPIYQGLLKAGESQTFDELRLYVNGAAGEAGANYVTIDTPNIQGETKKVQLVVIAEQDVNGRAAYQSYIYTDAQGIKYSVGETSATTGPLSDEAKQNTGTLSLVIPDTVPDDLGHDIPVRTLVLNYAIGGTQAQTIEISGGANLTNIAGNFTAASVEVLDLSGMNLSAIANKVNLTNGAFNNLANLTTIYVGSEEDKTLVEGSVAASWGINSVTVEVK